MTFYEEKMYFLDWYTNGKYTLNINAYHTIWYYTWHTSAIFEAGGNPFTPSAGIGVGFLQYRQIIPALFPWLCSIQSSKQSSQKQCWQSNLQGFRRDPRHMPQLPKFLPASETCDACAIFWSYWKGCRHCSSSSALMYVVFGLSWGPYMWHDQGEWVVCREYWL